MTDDRCGEMETATFYRRKRRQRRADYHEKDHFVAFVSFCSTGIGTVLPQRSQRAGMWFVKFKHFFSKEFWLNVGFWPGAEGRALRGRNLSAVFRNLNRQVGKPLNGLPSCAQPGG